MNRKTVKASIDIGSNSLNLLLAEISSDGELTELLSESHVTQLGKGVRASGLLSDLAMIDTYQALKHCCQKASTLGIASSEIITVATEAARLATNSTIFFTKVKDELGINVKIISGEEEARLAALGAASSTDQNKFFLLDIGGASTEFVEADKHPFHIASSISTPMGSVVATEWFAQGMFQNQLQNIFSKSSSLLSRFMNKDFLCVAGTITTLFTMINGLNSFDATSIEGQVITRNDFNAFVEQHKRFSSDELLAKYPFLGKRKDAIYAGMLLAQGIFNHFMVDHIICSTRGLRFGVLLDQTR